MRWLISFFTGRGCERKARLVPLAEFSPDSEVEALGYDETLLLTRQLMTLARRRKCACNHMGENNSFDERGLSWRVAGWYLGSGYTEKEMAQALESDLTAVMGNPAQISEVLQSKVIVGDSIFLPSEDYYGYGNINPFIFDSDKKPMDLRDTMFDQMSFPERVDTIISFDPEIRGHRHQIRYFRALQATYSIAHLLSIKTNDSKAQKLVERVFRDELSLARGWVTTIDHGERLGIDPLLIEPDESLLYNQDKVYESAMLLDSSGRSSRQMFAF